MKKIFTLVSLTTLLFSCSENIGETPFEEKLPINISVDVQTRANDTTFESGDAVGIYVVNYDGTTVGDLKAEGNQADNAEFTYDGGVWNSDEPIYWKDKNTSADFYAYYPYSASVNIAAQPFVVQADQSNAVNFWASDFLWGKSIKVSPTSKVVNIQTNHILSRIIVEIKPGSGFTSASWAAANKSVKICDIKTNATINLATGVATATGNNGEIIPLATSSNYKAMIVPQTVADDSKLVVVTVDGTEYVYRTGYTFKANTQHNFSIVVNKNESSVNVTIGEWNNDSTVNQGTAVEEESESLPNIIPDNQIWYTTTDGNVLNVTNTNTFNVSIESNIYGNNYGVITFSDSVSQIGETAFKNCSTLSAIFLPETIITIGYEAFKMCGNIEEVTLPESITMIDGDAFYGCSMLKKVYCKAATPPICRYGAFGNSTDIKIYVPASSVNAYKSAGEYWNYYTSNIEGYDF